MDDPLKMEPLWNQEPTVTCTVCNFPSLLKDIKDTPEFQRGEFKCLQCGAHQKTWVRKIGPLPFSKQDIFIKPLPLDERDIFEKPVSDEELLMQVILCPNCQHDMTEKIKSFRELLWTVPNADLLCPKCQYIFFWDQERDLSPRAIMSEEEFCDYAADLLGQQRKTSIPLINEDPSSGTVTAVPLDSFLVNPDAFFGNIASQSFPAKKVAIAKIDNGIVIDHIPAGKAFLISKILGLSKLAEESGDIIVFGVNFDSPTMGKKDVIKVENLSLTRDMLRVVSLIAPRATVTRIQDSQVVEKYAAEIPSVVNDIVICPDRSCITRHEEVPGRFLVLKTNPLTLKCHYCETEFYGALVRYKEGLRSWESE
jgi:aspartate carbamoyltransferase regulatory subunit